MLRLARSFLLVLVILPTIAQAQAKTHTDRDHGFSISFPAAWRVEPNYLGTAVFALSPIEGQEDTFRENINVVHETLPVVITSQQYYDANLKSMKAMLKDFSVSEVLSIQHQASPAILMIGAHTMGQNNVKTLALFYTHGKNGFVITCTAPPETFDRYKSDFQASLGSFNVLK